MESLEPAINLLKYRRREDLGRLLARAGMEFLPTADGFTGSDYNLVTIVKAAVIAPISDYDRLVSLSNDDRAVILETLQELWPYEEQEGGIAITEIGFRLNPDSLMSDSQDIDCLLEDLAYLKGIMIDVSTGGRPIDDVNPDFKEAYNDLSDRLRAKGIRNSIQYSDLWDWYGKWSSGELPSYRSRRQYVRSLLNRSNYASGKP